MGSVERVREYLKRVSLDHDFRELGSSTKSSSLAASALGCTVSEIAKSVVFTGAGTFVVVISGDKRVDLAKLDAVSGGALRVASPEEVREATGYPIGGVPPFPHGEGIKVLADRSILRFGHVWAAAGAPNAVFRADTRVLLGLIGSEPADLAA